MWELSKVMSVLINTTAYSFKEFFGIKFQDPIQDILNRVIFCL